MQLPLCTRGREHLSPWILTDACCVILCAVYFQICMIHDAAILLWYFFGRFNWEFKVEFSEKSCIFSPFLAQWYSEHSEERRGRVCLSNREGVKWIVFSSPAGCCKRFYFGNVFIINERWWLLLSTSICHQLAPNVFRLDKHGFSFTAVIFGSFVTWSNLTQLVLAQ